MQQTYVPVVCKATEDGKKKVEAKYEGTITLKVPSYDERMEILESLEFDASDLDEKKSDDEMKADKVKRQLKKLRTAAQNVPKYLVGSTVKRKSDGYLFDTWDKLQYDTDMMPLIREAAFKIIGNFSVNDPS